MSLAPSIAKGGTEQMNLCSGSLFTTPQIHALWINPYYWVGSGEAVVLQFLKKRKVYFYLGYLILQSCKLYVVMAFIFLHLSFPYF